VKKFTKVMLSLCFLALVVNVIETNQVRLQTKSPTEETLEQKFLYSFSTKVKLGQKYTNKNNLEITIKDKNISDKIVAPVSKVSYNYWGESFSQDRYYTPKDENNRFVYVNANIKSLSNKKSDLDDLIKANVIYYNKYEFECFASKTTKDKSDFTTDIKVLPLQSSDVYFIAEVPKELINDEKPLTMEFKTNNTKYVMNLR
jgi:hypothetical protein